MRDAPAALARALPVLRCPHCGDLFHASPTGVVCDRGHAFDRDRRGFLTLLGGRGRRFHGDTTEQVDARDRVFSAGVFDPVARSLAEAAAESVTVARSVTVAGTRAAAEVDAPVVLDVGAGTGFHLSRVLDTITGGAGDGGAGAVLGIGTEISTAAARRLARAHPLAAAIVTDTWQGLPVADRCVDVLTVVFAPRNAAEFARVIRPGGTLLVAVPGDGHLEPLRTEARMLEPSVGKAARLGEDLGAAFVAGPVHDVDLIVDVGASVAVDLVLMGPSGVHLDRTVLESALGTEAREVRLHVEVRSYRRT